MIFRCREGSQNPFGLLLCGEREARRSLGGLVKEIDCGCPKLNAGLGGRGLGGWGAEHEIKENKFR